MAASKKAVLVAHEAAVKRRVRKCPTPVVDAYVTLRVKYVVLVALHEHMSHRDIQTYINNLEKCHGR